jgi:hypothetical protein
MGGSHGDLSCVAGGGRVSLPASSLTGTAAGEPDPRIGLA